MMQVYSLRLGFPVKIYEFDDDGKCKYDLFGKGEDYETVKKRYSHSLYFIIVEDGGEEGGEEDKRIE